jgi:hypothetical protein
VNCYEHPTRLRERRLVITPADCFPYAAGVPGARPGVAHHRATRAATSPLEDTRRLLRTTIGALGLAYAAGPPLPRRPHDTHRLDDEEGELIMGAPAGVELYVAEQALGS